MANEWDVSGYGNVPTQAVAGARGPEALPEGSAAPVVDMPGAPGAQAAAPSGQGVPHMDASQVAAAQAAAQAAAASGMSPQTGRVEAYDVPQSNDFFFMPANKRQAGGSHGSGSSSGSTSHHHHHHHHSGGSGSSSSRKAEQRAKRTRTLALRLLAFFLVLLLVAVGVCGLLLYRSAVTVSSQASAAVAQATEVKGRFKDGDFEGMTGSANRMAQAAKSMRAEVNSPIWDMAALLPPLSGDVRKVRNLADIFCDLVDNAVQPVVDSMSGKSLSDLLGAEGYVDVDLLQDFIDGLENANAVIDSSLDAVNAMGDADMQFVNDRLKLVREQMQAIDGMMDRALKIARPLPGMLGANGTRRRYVVNALQPAELRAGGGVAGATGILEVTDGHLDLGFFTDFTRNLVPGSQVPELTADEYALFGEVMQNEPRNAYLTPDYERAQQVFAQAWAMEWGDYVDGVISVDPLFLQRVLRFVGGVTTRGGWEIDGKNADEVLMNRVYVPVENANSSAQLAAEEAERLAQQQEPLFTDLAQLVLEQFINHLDKVSFTDFLELVRWGGSSQHVHLWMADETEQDVMREVNLSGELATDEDDGPVLGVYVNDYSMGMLDWYLDLRTTMDDGTEHADGSVTYRVTTTVRNVLTVPEVLASNLTVMGWNPNRRNDGDMTTELLLVAPVGGTVDDVRVAGSFLGSDPVVYPLNGLYLYEMWFRTNIGESTKVTYTVTTAPKTTAKLTLRQTPTCRTFK